MHTCTHCLESMLQLWVTNTLWPLRESTSIYLTGWLVGTVTLIHWLKNQESLRHSDRQTDRSPSLHGCFSCWFLVSFSSIVRRKRELRGKKRRRKVKKVVIFPEQKVCEVFVVEGKKVQKLKNPIILFCRGKVRIYVRHLTLLFLVKVIVELSIVRM